MMNKLIDFYRSRGLCVVPAVYRDKRPAIDWGPYQGRKPTDEEIERWFNDSKARNVAIVCGAVSGNLVVLDFDDLGVYNRFLDTRKLESRTVVIKTGGGKRHVYLRTPKPSASFKIPEIKLEVRSTGSIVIAPPSLHPIGNRYEFVNPEVRAIAVVRDLEEAVWEISGAKFGVRRPGFLPREPGESRKNWKVERPYRGKHPPCIKELLQGVAEGFRNEAALRLSGYFLFTKDEGITKVRARLARWNELNQPPLPASELESVFRSALHRGYVFGCHGLSALCEREHCPFELAKWRTALERSGVTELLDDLENPYE